MFFPPSAAGHADAGSLEDPGVWPSTKKTQKDERPLISPPKLFGAIYLLGHGVVKAGLMAALLFRRRCAYPAAILAFGLFLAYQLYRYSHTHSLWLPALSLLDALVIVLTWLEYRRLRRSYAFPR